jgi:hypothetical protein
MLARSRQEKGGQSQVAAPKNFATEGSMSFPRLRMTLTFLPVSSPTAAITRTQAEKARRFEIQPNCGRDAIYGTSTLIAMASLNLLAEF